jgi:hypothetical protein
VRAAWQTYSLPAALLSPDLLGAMNSVNIYYDADGEVSVNKLNGPSMNPLDLPARYGGGYLPVAVNFTIYNTTTQTANSTFVVPGHLVKR